MPISLHPAFPAIVALWFAALLGLGSMILPVVLIERAVEVTGIAALIPAASPPLGLMARSLIALASALAGAVIGVAIARRVARAHDTGRPLRVAKLAKGARRPIDVNEELGGEGLVNGFGLPVNRRRALAIAEDDRPSDFLYMAPLPGHDADDLSLAFDEPPAAPRSADEPFELSDAFEDPAEAGEPEAWDHAEPDPDEDAPMSFKQEFQLPAPEPRTEARQEFVPQAEPLPFSAPSLARRALAAEAFAPEPEPELEPAPAIPQAYEPDLDALAAVEPEPEASEPQPFRGDWSNAPVDELGLVQLVQRLGSSLERRREWLATVAVAATPAPVLAPTAGFDPAPAEEAAEAMAAYFGKPAGDAPAAFGTDAADEQPAPPAPMDLTRRPSLLGAWPTDDDDDDADAMPSFTLPLRKAVAPTIAFGAAEEPQDDGLGDAGEDEGDDSYSSLLAMRNPFTVKDNGFVRIDEPEADDHEVQPTVVFPGSGESASEAAEAGFSAARAFDPPAGFGDAPALRSQAAPAGTDAALRSALATLQRMSGTA